MHDIPPTDPGRAIDWSRASADYARHRQGYPPSFFARLAALGVGLPHQRILDLGTGTGLLARVFARAGATVTGIDNAAGQIDEARALARAENLSADFRVAPAEDTGLLSHSFDLVTASQCWLYFDKARAVPEVRRLLAPGGRLLTCHLCWLPRLDPLARRTEEIVLRHNPAWAGADWSGIVPPMPAWAEGAFELEAMFRYDEPLHFTREGWRGRIRACRGVGASLPPEGVQAVDDALAALLAGVPSEPFPILHRIDAHLFAPIDTVPGRR